MLSCFSRAQEIQNWSNTRLVLPSYDFCWSLRSLSCLAAHHNVISQNPKILSVSSREQEAPRGARLDARRSPVGARVRPRDTSKTR